MTPPRDPVPSSVTDAIDRACPAGGRPSTREERARPPAIRARAPLYSARIPSSLENPHLGTAAQHAVESLRRTLIEGELRPGERVRQEEIAERLGLSLAPVREALAVLEGEGQLTYLPRRGYFVTELDLGDLREIYDLRRLVEGRAARRALPLLDPDAHGRIDLAARDCAEAARRGDVTAELEANRSFHFAVLEAPGQAHTMRIVRLLWDSTETYRALYYNDPADREDSLAAHERIVAAIGELDADRLVAELDAHREAALDRLAQLLDTSTTPRG